MSHGSDTSGAPRVAYCVRLCDGRYFPISAGRTAAETCNSLCPGSATRLFYGRQIDSAYDRQGQGYRQLENAFVYRTKIVPNCTCGGKAGFGVAQVPIVQDPTLRSGDIVAGASGLTVYRGSTAERQPIFTPIESANLSRRLQEELSEVEVGPRPTFTGAAEPTPPSVEETASAYAGEREASREPTAQERVQSGNDALDPTSRER